MKLFTRLNNAVKGAAMALPLLLGAPAWALAAAPPAALSTLDVCHNALTGNWRYSGAVVLTGAALTPTTIAGIDYWVQNSVSPAGYADTLRVTGMPQAAATGTTRVARFSTEAPPLSTGTLRNSTRIVIGDLLAPAAPSLLLQSTADYTQAICGCPHPAGCTRTQGYWKSKPGVIWPAPYSRTDLPFFSSGLNWQQVLETPPQGGNAYVILAHQYIAAVLNRAAGASAPASLQAIINQASTWFSSGTTLASCGASACDTQKNWAALLDSYNNGLYPGAPTHCP
jgi:hypothetical protein